MSGTDDSVSTIFGKDQACIISNHRTQEWIIARLAKLLYSPDIRVQSATFLNAADTYHFL